MPAVALSATLALAACEAWAAGPQLLADAGTGQVIAAEDADLSWHPASLTKIMTAHLALKAVRSGRLSMDSPVVMSAHAASQPPSKLGLRQGQALKLGTALSVMLTKSANDVAVAVGEAVGGSEKAFADMMNEEAYRLGMLSTRFVNASGLHADAQVTTARDIAVLALAVLRTHPDHADLFSARSVKVGGRTLMSTNRLLGKYDGLDGMKTGYVCASGFNIVTTAERDGRRLVAVVLGEGSTKRRTTAARRLLDLGFSRDGQTGIRLSSYATTASAPPPDLRRHGCGRSWKGSRSATEVAVILPNDPPVPAGRPELPLMAVTMGSPVSWDRDEEGEGDGMARAPNRF